MCINTYCTTCTHDSEGEKVAKSLGSKAVFAAADVTSEEQINNALDKAVSNFGSAPNVVVNCAGENYLLCTMHRIDMQTFISLYSWGCLSLVLGFLLICCFSS